MSRTLLIIGACLGIFLSGAIAGGFVALRNFDRFTHRRAADSFAQQHFRRVAEQLDLTDQQRQRIRPLIARAGRDLQETRRRATTIFERLEAEVKLELTPEQRQRFDKLKIRFRNVDKGLQRPLRDLPARPREGRPLPKEASESGKQPSS